MILPVYIRLPYCHTADQKPVLTDCFHTYIHYTAIFSVSIVSIRCAEVMAKLEFKKKNKKTKRFSCIGTREEEGFSMMGWLVFCVCVCVDRRLPRAGSNGRRSRTETSAPDDSQAVPAISSMRSLLHTSATESEARACFDGASYAFAFAVRQLKFPNRLCGACDLMPLSLSRWQWAKKLNGPAQQQPHFVANTRCPHCRKFRDQSTVKRF